MILKNLVEEIRHDIGRTFIVGDIHGCYDEFIQQLDEVGFNFDEDLCIAVGDLVDRGDKSLDCFNLIYKSWFKTVRGNHEQFCLDSVKYDMEQDIKDFHIRHGGEWFYKLPDDVMRKIADDINDLPVALILNRNDKKYLILHGDMPSSFKNLDDLKSGLESTSQELHTNTILLGRRLIDQIRKIGYVEPFGGVDQVFFGHSVVHKVQNKANYTFLDTGCFLKESWSKLTMMEVN